MYELFAGPMVWVAFALFFAGLVVQAFRFFKMTKKREKVLPPNAPKREWPKVKGPMDLYRLGVGIYDRLVDGFRGSIAGTHPVMTIVTVTFHVLLFATPIFLFAHNEMIRDGIGIALPAMHEGFADLLTVVVMLCLAIFLFRRVFLARVRAITSGYDYFVLLVTAAPFVTGFLAYHQVFEYRTILLIHIIAGEAMLVLIPWTRLGHALFFFLYRLFIPGEYSFGRGGRTWQPGPARR